MHETFAIVVAAGKGLRMGSKTKKQYLCLDKIPVLARTIMTLERCVQRLEIVLVIPKEDMEYCQKNIIDPFGFAKKIHLVEGGNKRQDSVLNGLERVQTILQSEAETIVLIHDGVRPFVDQSIFDNCIANAIEYGACIPVVKITDTVKQLGDNLSVAKTVDREFLYGAQTPQAFKLDLILRAFDHARKTSFSGTDEASLIEHLGHRVMTINGSKLNIKMTTPEDLVLGKALLNSF